MGKHKRIVVSLPDGMLREVDGITSMEKLNRSELIREAMRQFLEERKKREMRERLRRGYLEMAEINLELAEEGLWVDEATPVLTGSGGRRR
ncbi:MAG: ribbon-helix-helix protein, CopG family [Bacillota bacterium]